MTQQTLDVEGLRCDGCVDTVTETLLAIAGVTAVDVTLNTTSPSIVRIEAVDEVDLDLVQRSLAEQGDFRVRR